MGEVNREYVVEREGEREREMGEVNRDFVVEREGRGRERWVR